MDDFFKKYNIKKVNIYATTNPLNTKVLIESSFFINNFANNSFKF